MYTTDGWKDARIVLRSEPAGPRHLTSQNYEPETRLLRRSRLPVSSREKPSFLKGLRECNELARNAASEIHSGSEARRLTVASGIANPVIWTLIRNGLAVVLIVGNAYRSLPFKADLEGFCISTLFRLKYFINVRDDRERAGGWQASESMPAPHIRRSEPDPCRGAATPAIACQNQPPPYCLL